MYVLIYCSFLVGIEYSCVYMIWRLFDTEWDVVLNTVVYRDSDSEKFS